MANESRPLRFGGPFKTQPFPLQTELDLAGMDPDVVGDRVVRAIKDRELYIFTHLQTKEWLLARHDRIVDAFDACESWVSEAPEHRTAKRLTYPSRDNR
jgi:hypothetical protein